MAELHDLTALEQGKAIRAGEVSPTELAEHYLDRVDRHNDTLGAFITVTPEIARKQAADAEAEALAARRDDRRRHLSPLHGVPVPVKDLNFVAGVRCTLGSQAYADHVPDVDDHVAAKLRAAGTVLLGKTNTPEFGLPCYTENKLAPPARTPWDLERSAGGSSGGAAAAVAGGSPPRAGQRRRRLDPHPRVRVRPVRHQAQPGKGERGPGAARRERPERQRPDRPYGRGRGGPARRPRGPDAGRPVQRALAAAGRVLLLLRRPRSGDTARGRAAPAPVPGVELHPDCRAAYDGAAELLRGLGHQVDEVELPVDDAILHAFTRVWGVMATVYPVAPEQEELLMPLTRHLRAEGGKVSGPDFAASLYAFRALGQLIADALLSSYDLVLTPTLARPPAFVGSAGLRNDADPAAEFAGLAGYTPFTPISNATGQPAVNVPLHWTEEGLPIGVMFGGRYGDEAMLISLSAQLESARPWAGRRPAIW